MTASEWFWGGALLNMAVLTGFAVRGVRQARRGEITRHRRSMLVAASLVGAFLGAYILKVVLVGREDFGLWSAADVSVLRFHEACVLAMLVAGGLALERARRMRRSRQVTRDPADPPAPLPVVRRHRIAGRVALVGALLGLVSACFVWAGMLGRAS